MDNIVLRPPVQMGEIHVENLICDCLCGVYERERLAPQPLAVSGRLAYPIEGCTRTDAMADGIDYGALRDHVREFLGTGEFYLLETAALGLCRATLTKFPAAEHCQFSLRKTTTSAAKAGIQLAVRVAVRKSIALLGLGSNLGDRAANLAGAREAIGIIPFTGVLGRSTIHRTEPLSVKDQPEFLNQTIRVETLLSPMELLRHTGKIEENFGRRRDLPNGPRTLDIDILLFEGIACCHPELTIPHPAIRLRRFWIEELAELGIPTTAADPSVWEQGCTVFFSK